MRAALPSSPVRVLPVSDGGSGLLDVLAALRDLNPYECEVAGPLGEPVSAAYGIGRCGGRKIGVVESGNACGLHLIPSDRRDPMITTSRGVGELMRVLVRGPQRVQHILLGLGGSGTVDGGLGMAAALGWRFLDRAGRPVPPGGHGLAVLESIIPPASIASGAVPGELAPTVLADVDNPLLGHNGAATVYGPQKGASPEQVRRLEEGLARLADLIRREFGRDVASIPGGGAAGGLGAAAVAFLGGELVSGADWMLEAVDFEAHLSAADVVITGEGAVDRQSGMGKVVGKVVESARDRGVAVLVIAGRVDTELPEGVARVDSGGRMVDADGLADLAVVGLTRLLEEGFPG